jgi:hypothetical protein
MQFVLVGFDNGDIMDIDTELSTTQMLAQTGRLDRRRSRMLLRVCQIEALTAETHGEMRTRMYPGGAQVVVVKQGRRSKEEAQRKRRGFI